MGQNASRLTKETREACLQPRNKKRINSTYPDGMRQLQQRILALLLHGGRRLLHHRGPVEGNEVNGLLRVCRAKMGRVNDQLLRDRAK